MVGDNHYKKGQKGNKILDVDNYKSSKSENDKIPKISESHCIELMSRHSLKP
jgi:hypothetical protein